MAKNRRSFPRDVAADGVADVLALPSPSAGPPQVVLELLLKVELVQRRRLYPPVREMIERSRVTNGPANIWVTF